MARHLFPTGKGDENVGDGLPSSSSSWALNHSLRMERTVEVIRREMQKLKGM